MSKFLNFVRSVHYKPLKKYPVVNIKDVDLTRGRGKKPTKKLLLSQTVTDTLFPSTEISKLYQEKGAVVPRKFFTNSEAISRRSLELYQEAIATGEAHFRVGEKQVYLPKARVILLRPNAKHTPYQAKFLVPRNFNKLDLRDYLWHVYGLRALNVTTQLLHAKWQRNTNDYARHRGPQFKKMTIDMEEPFVWPSLEEGREEEAKARAFQTQSRAQIAALQGEGAPVPETVLDGLYTKPKLANQFIPRKFRVKGSKELETYNTKVGEKANEKLVSEYLKL